MPPPSQFRIVEHTSYLTYLRTYDTVEIEAEIREIENDKERTAAQRKNEIRVLHHLLISVQQLSRSDRLPYKRAGRPIDNSRTLTRVKPKRIPKDQIDAARTRYWKTPDLEINIPQTPKKHPDQAIADAAHIYLQITGIATLRVMAQTLNMEHPSDLRGILQRDARFQEGEKNWFSLVKSN